MTARRGAFSAQVGAKPDNDPSQSVILCEPRFQTRLDYTGITVGTQGTRRVSKAAGAHTPQALPVALKPVAFEIEKWGNSSVLQHELVGAYHTALVTDGSDRLVPTPTQ